MSDQEKPKVIKKPDYTSPRYYKTVDGKIVFNQKRFNADLAYYNKMNGGKNE